MSNGAEVVERRRQTRVTSNEFLGEIFPEPSSCQGRGRVLARSKTLLSLTKGENHFEIVTFHPGTLAFSLVNHSATLVSR